MTKTFKVGDKVRAIDNYYGQTTLDYGFEGVVTYLDERGKYSIKQTKPDDKFIKFKWTGLSAEHFELLDATPTKSQRISTLETEVEALKAEVAKLKESQEKAPLIPKSSVFQPKETPNQRRKAVIDRAKAFVADVEERAIGDKKNREGNYTYRERMTKPEFHVNAKKRCVTVLAKGETTGTIKEKAISHCAPGDVFNEHIGKAIALAKAYDLEVPREFTHAPQPEIAVGQRIENCDGGIDVLKDEMDRLPYSTLISGGTVRGRAFHMKETSGWIAESQITQILDDSEAQYDA